MDTSKEYVEMCEKAREVTRGYTSKQGDFAKVGDAIDIAGKEGWLEGDGSYTDKIIWLPRQDQLQEMSSFDVTLWGTFYDMYEFTKEHEWYDNGDDIRYDSMEQIWLAYVMYKLYKKKWDLGDWVWA